MKSVGCGIISHTPFFIPHSAFLTQHSQTMPLLSFFIRRLLTGIVARSFTNFLVKRFQMSPSMANLVFVVLAELLARGTEKPTMPGRGRGRGFAGFRG